MPTWFLKNTSEFLLAIYPFFLVLSVVNISGNMRRRTISRLRNFIKRLYMESFGGRKEDMGSAWRTVMRIAMWTTLIAGVGETCIRSQRLTEITSSSSVRFCLCFCRPPADNDMTFYVVLGEDPETKSFYDVYEQDLNGDNPEFGYLEESQPLDIVMEDESKNVEAHKDEEEEDEESRFVTREEIQRRIRELPPQEEVWSSVLTLQLSLIPRSPVTFLTPTM